MWMEGGLQYWQCSQNDMFKIKPISFSSSNYSIFGMLNFAF